MTALTLIFIIGITVSWILDKPLYLDESEKRIERVEKKVSS